MANCSEHASKAPPEMTLFSLSRNHFRIALVTSNCSQPLLLADVTLK